MSRLLVIILLFCLVFHKRMPFVFNFYGWKTWKELYNDVENVMTLHNHDNYTTFKWNNHPGYLCDVYEYLDNMYCEIYDINTHRIIFSSYWYMHSNKLALKLIETKNTQNANFTKTMEQFNKA